MADDWEDSGDDETPKVLPGRAVVDSEDDSDAASDWEVDSDEEREKAAEKARQAAALKPKKQSQAKILARQKRLEEEEQKRLAQLSEVERMAEKLRAQKLVEEQDNKLTEELFGVSSNDATEAKPAGAVGVLDEEAALYAASDGEEEEVKVVAPVIIRQGIEDEVLKETEDFEKLAKKIAAKVGKDGSVPQTVTFLKTLLGECALHFATDDLQSINRTVTALITAQRKVENAAKKKGGKKKKKGTTVNLGSSRGVAGMGDYHNDAMDHGDDYDFM